MKSEKIIVVDSNDNGKAESEPITYKSLCEKLKADYEAKQLKALSDVDGREKVS